MPKNGCEDAPGPAYTGNDSREAAWHQENIVSPSPSTTAPQQGWEDPGVPTAGTVQRAVAKEEQGRTALPRLLPLCSHASLQSLYPQILLAPCPDPPPPYIAPNCKQVSLQERWHHPSTYFSIVRGPSLYSRMEKRRRLLTPFCPGTLESTSDSTTDICVSLCVSRDI